MTNGQFNNVPYPNQPTNENGTTPEHQGYAQPMQQPVQTQQPMQTVDPNQQYGVPQQQQAVYTGQPVNEQQQFVAQQPQYQQPVQQQVAYAQQAVEAQQPQYQNLGADMGRVPTQVEHQTVQPQQGEPQAVQQQSVVSNPSQVLGQAYVDTPLSPSSIQDVGDSQLANAQWQQKMQVDIIADIGNSGSRVVVDTPTTRFYFEMDNKYAFIPDISTIDRKYIGRKSTIIKDHKTSGYYANGHIVDVEFPNNLIKPIGFHRKAEQPITYVTLRAIIAKTMVILAEHFNVPNIDCDITLNVLFPPLEALPAGGLIQSRMVEEGLNVLHCISPFEMQKDINVTINALAEGICGYFSSFFNEVGVVPYETNSAVVFGNGDYEVYDVSKAVVEAAEQNIDFHHGDFLVIDIGAGTSDMLLGRNLEIIERSRDTIRLGGNSVESAIKKGIRTDFGMEITAENVLELVSKGYFTEGSHQHNGIKYVREARETYARAFKEKLVAYFDEQMYEPRQLKGLLVFGGGALETTNTATGEKAEAMAHFIIKFLKEDLCPFVTEIYTNPAMLRRANVNGGTMFTRYE